MEPEPALSAGLQQTRLDQEILRKAPERVFARVSHASGACPRPSEAQLRRNVPRVEVFRGGVAGARQPLGVEALRGRDGLEEAIPPLLARSAAFAPRMVTPKPTPKRLDGLGEISRSLWTPKGRTSARAAQPKQC
jgi:hypothetical protein